jgi:RNA polymerase sigma-70 factor (ECF subfamily)
MANERPHLLAAMRGDSEALSCLWRDHRRWVAAVLLAHLPGGVELEDLLQDVAVTFCANLHRLRDPQSFRSWLRSIAVNVAHSAGRRRRVQKKVLGRWPQVGDADPIDPATNRERQRQADKERLGSVLRILRTMHADYREPMWLRAVAGLSQQAIADALSLPVTTIETRLSRGRRMLRLALADLDRPLGNPTTSDDALLDEDQRWTRRTKTS